MAGEDGHLARSEHGSAIRRPGLVDPSRFLLGTRRIPFNADHGGRRSGATDWAAAAGSIAGRRTYVCKSLAPGGMALEELAQPLLSHALLSSRATDTDRAHLSLT